MPSNNKKETELKSLINEYIDDDEALEVAISIFNYIVTYASNKAGLAPPSRDASDIALRLPVFGFIGNKFWHEKSQFILPVFQQDIINIDVHFILNEKHEMSMPCSILFSYQSLGRIVAVQQSSIDKQIEFDIRFKEMLIESMSNG